MCDLFVLRNPGWKALMSSIWGAFKRGKVESPFIPYKAYPNKVLSCKKNLKYFFSVKKPSFFQSTSFTFSSIKISVIFGEKKSKHYLWKIMRSIFFLSSIPWMFNITFVYFTSSSLTDSCCCSLLHHIFHQIWSTFYLFRMNFMYTKMTEHACYSGEIEQEDCMKFITS